MSFLAAIRVFKSSLGSPFRHFSQFALHLASKLRPHRSKRLNNTDLLLKYLGETTRIIMAHHR
jgi:hypothetical protein